MLYSSLGLSFVISYTSIMAYSLLKSILIAAKCINIYWKNNTESSIFTFFLLSQTQLQNSAYVYLHWRWPTQKSEKYESWRRPCLTCRHYEQLNLGNQWQSHCKHKHKLWNFSSCGKIPVVLGFFQVCDKAWVANNLLSSTNYNLKIVNI